MRQAVRRVMLPRVHRVKRGSKLHRYHRVTRAKLPDDVPEDDPIFLTAWLAEEAKGAPRLEGHPQGSIRKAVDDFLGSKVMREVSPAYAAMLRRHLFAVAKDYGPGKLTDLETKHIRKDVERLDNAVAQHRLKAWRRMLKWAVKEELLKADPSAGIERPQLEPSEGHIPWSREDVAAFRARWPIGTAPRAAMELLHWSGARVSDAVKLTHGMVRDGLLTYKQSKTEKKTKGENEAHIPWNGPLPDFARRMEADRAMMHEALAAFAPPALLVLPTHNGKQRTAKGLSNTVNDAARDAGLVERTAHGLRKTRLIACAEAGATAHQIQAWGGHASLKEIEDYTRSADRRRALSGVQVVNGADPAVNAAEIVSYDRHLPKHWRSREDAATPAMAMT